MINSYDEFLLIIFKWVLIADVIYFIAYGFATLIELLIKKIKKRKEKNNKDDTASTEYELNDQIFENKRKEIIKKVNHD